MRKAMKTRLGPRRRERGAALVVAILVLAILTVIGIALMLITSTESRIAANEWSVNRAFYSADAGLRWATAEMTDPTPFGLKFGGPFDTVLFQMSSHRNGLAGFFTGDLLGTEIQVTVQKPSLVGRRPYPGGLMNGPDPQYIYEYEARAQGAQNDQLLQYSKALVADISVGPGSNTPPF